MEETCGAFNNILKITWEFQGLDLMIVVDPFLLRIFHGSTILKCWVYENQHTFCICFINFASWFDFYKLLFSPVFLYL